MTTVAAGRPRSQRSGRSAVTKARARAEAPQSPLARLAAGYEVALAERILEAMRALARQITVSMVTEALRSPASVGPLYAALDAAPIVKAVAEPTPEVVAGLEARLDVVSPLVVRAAETQAANLVVEVGGETKRAIRRIIAESSRGGLSPLETTRRIRQIVGLSERQAIAVGNFRQGLEELAEGRGTRRGVQSRWTLSGKIPAKALTERQIDDLVSRYAERQRSYRAQTIARTETMRASNAGQQLAWEQMTRTGLIDPVTFRRKWVVAKDERTCARCMPLDGKEVGLKERFREVERGVLPSQRKEVRGETVLVPPL